MAVATEEQIVEKHRGAPMKRSWAIWLGLGMAALLAVGGVVLGVYWPFTSKRVISAMAEDWPGKITAQRVHSTYFPHPGCVLESVTFTRGNNPAAPPIVTMQKMTIAANYHDLFLRPGYLSRITLEGLKVSVPAQQPADGSLAKPGKSTLSRVRVGEVFTKDAVLEVARDSNSALNFQIHQLTLNSVSSSGPMKYDLAMLNAVPPGELRAHGEFGPYDADKLETIPLQGDYTFEQADLSVFEGIAGTLAAKGEFHGALGKIETQGTTDIPNFEVRHSQHRVPVKAKYQATVDGVGGDTVLRAVDATIVRTNAHFDGTITGKAGQAGKTTTVNVAVQDGYIEDILRVFVKEHKSALDGKANFQARVSWPSEGDNFIKKVKLDGEFAIDGAHSEHNLLQNDLIQLSKRASGKKNDKTPVDENVTMDLKGKVAMAKGIANLTDALFSVPGAQANLHGTYDLRSTKLDLRGDLKTETTLSNEETGAKAILLKPLDPLFKRKHAGAVIPVQMTGTFHDAHVGLALPIPK
jgi:hypothetical protein